MQIGPRYKRARRLGAPVFSKTQTQKYAMRSQGDKPRGRPMAKSEYGKQMQEKQKARYSYGVSSGQFTKYVKMALRSAGNNRRNLIHFLESRLDNVVLKAGFSNSRSGARQMVAHGHFRVNGKPVNVPSYSVRVGDSITIREGSKMKKIFSNLDEKLKESAWPKWMTVDTGSKEIKIQAEPEAEMTELLFDVGQVLEFYTR